MWDTVKNIYLRTTYLQRYLRESAAKIRTKYSNHERSYCTNQTTIDNRNSGMTRQLLKASIYVIKRVTFGLAFVHRWMKGETHQMIRHLYDTSLPQFDESSEYRQEELLTKKRLYEYHQYFPGSPVQVKMIPEVELFSDSYKVRHHE